MEGDRRQSMRVPTRLPCKWQLFDSQPTQQQLYELFDLHRSMAYQRDIEHLNDDIQSSLHGISDANTRHALMLINNKVDLLAEQQSSSPKPPETDLVLSLSGVDLLIDTPVEPGHWLGMQLVLDEGYRLVESGCITRCTPTEGKFLMGVVFEEMSSHSARRLARFVMRQPNDAVRTD
jgi:hypothetical protein